MVDSRASEATLAGSTATDAITTFLYDRRPPRILDSRPMIPIRGQPYLLSTPGKGGDNEKAHAGPERAGGAVVRHGRLGRAAVRHRARPAQGAHRPAGHRLLGGGRVSVGAGG